ncbi:MAG: EhaD family protein [Methanolinea sp.]|nr:EhaD family protein [Methanolinea sp.]
MNEIVVVMLAALVVLGCVLAIRESDPYRKLIALSLIIGGTIPFIVDRGLLDVAAAVALISPLSTIFILMACPGGEP